MIKQQLSNGLRIISEHIPTARSVSFGIWVKTGSRNEDQRNNGISHFIEHMLFKGTDKYSAKDIADIFDGLGGSVNAFTAKEYTCYYAKVLDQHLPIAVDVLSQMFFNSQFDDNELSKERNVILEEIAMYEDTPDDLVHDLAAKASYGTHALGYSILGLEANLNRFGPEDLRAYMKRHYRIDNTVISMAGNLNDSAFELVERYFGDFHNQGQAPAEQLPTYTGEQIYHAKKTEQNHICLSLPGCSASDDKLYAMILLNNTIGGGMSSRLFQEIREMRGLAYSVYSYHTAHADSGLFTIYTGTARKQTSEVLEVMMEVLHELQTKGLTEAELAKGKEQLKGSLILGLESVSSRMNRLGKNELMIGKHYTLDEVIKKIENVTMEDVWSVISGLFSHAFSLSMVGQSDQAIAKFRRDQLVLPRSN